MNAKRLLFVIMAIVLLQSCERPRIDVQSRGIVLPDTTVVHYLEAGQGPVLVLVHGLGSSSEIWRETIIRLARDYRVIAPDLPGYGKSDRPRADYSVRYHAASLTQFLDVLGIEKAALAGNSLGGWLAVLAALDRPENITHLILVDSAGLLTDRLPQVTLNPSTAQEERALLDALFGNKAHITDELVAEVLKYRRSVSATVLATLASFRSNPPFLDARLKDIKVPTLVVWGGQDMLTPLELSERFVKGIPGARRIVIEGAGHTPQVEAPKEFARAVKGFVRSW